MTEAEGISVFKCLADKSRLQILKSLAVEDMYVELLAQRLDLTPATISFHLKKLADAGTVRTYKSQYYTMYTLCPDIFRTRILDIIQETSDEAALQNRREAAYRQEEIAKSFQHGRPYSEREVNLIIADFHDDFCTIHRNMIGEGIMSRDRNSYWLIPVES